MKILILGGTGNLSSRITETALNKNHDVILFNRGKHTNSFINPKVKIVSGDRNELEKYSAEINSYSPDAIIDTICFKPSQAKSLINAFKKIKRIVVISTVDVYGEDVGCAPVTEDKMPSPATIYSKDRYECEKILLKDLPDQISIFRLSHILGKGFLTASLWSRSPYLVDRILKNKPVPAIDGGRNLMTPVFSKDAAEWIIRSLDIKGSTGNVFNACGSDIITQKYYYETIAKILNKNLNLYYVPSPVFKKNFDTPSHFNFHRPYSNKKIIDLTKYIPNTTLEIMMKETIDHMIDNNLVKDSSEDPFDDALTDLLIKQEQELDVLFKTKIK